MPRIAFLSICLCSLWLSLSSCSEEPLSSESVLPQPAPTTALDRWCQSHFTTPYQLEVVYRWGNHSAGQQSTWLYPPKEEKVQPILEIIDKLVLQLYADPATGFSPYLYPQHPVLRLHLFGGANRQASGVELLHNPLASSLDLYVYEVNSFNAQQSESVYRLVRSLHQQMARHLFALRPYNVSDFRKISPNKYLSETELELPLSSLIAARGRQAAITLSDYALQRGCFTMLALRSAADDFAETYSTLLCHTPAELRRAEQTAAEPYSTSDPDPEVNARYAQEAQEAHAAIVAKRDFLTRYLEKEWHISATRLQLASLQRLQSYLHP